jgi:acylphosphatase
VIARKIHYSGRVQGVGFRETARRIAAEHAVVGSVRNLDNGEVELVVEGAAEEVDRYLSALARRMAGYIEGQRAADEPVRHLVGFIISR